MARHGCHYPPARRMVVAAATFFLLVASTGAAVAAPPAAGEYFPTLPVGAALPRSDADCAARVTRHAWEPRPENASANQAVPSGAVPWNTNPAWTYWRAFVAKRDKVSGAFTGTTDEVIQWGACKWGIDEDVLRAVAVQESSWRQGHEGDYENGRYHSFGLMQIRHDDAAGALVKGGHPATLAHTALNVDYFGAEMRACFEGDFYDGGPWLYGGAQVKGDLWGCLGYWYSGNWYTAAARDYIAKVQGHLAAKPWVAWGYPGKASASGPSPPSTPSMSTALRVSGNKLVDGAGNVVTLRGVNRAGPEYACVQGWGIFEGPTDAASVRAIQSWHANVVHIGLNETCILGINGVSSAYSGSNYMNAVVAYVNLLHQHGIYAEVSLMWAAPGTQRATGHPPILNQDHSADALKAIATAFKNDPMTIIGLQSEPREISWACWRNGGSSCSVGYAALGMQAALDAVRSTGATNVVTVSGIDYANNLSQWLAYRPTDPTGQLMAEAHVYGGNVCSTTACFDREYAPVVSSVPVIFGEFGEHYDGSCDSTNTRAILDWADAHGVSYAAWTWNIWGGCLDLIASYDGTVKNTNYARFVRDRLLSHG